MTRFYRFLLRLYPKWFRREYGEDLTRAFAESTRGRSSASAAATALADVVPNAILSRWDSMRQGGGGMVRTDLRVACRHIARTPLFSTVVIAVIGLGIGINAGLLTTLHVYAWRPAPGIEPDDRLVRLTASVTGAEGEHQVRLSFPEIRELREEHRLFTEVAGWRATGVAADLGGGAESVVGFYVSADFFRTLGIQLAAGSGFAPDADQVAMPGAVIGHSLWLSHFNGSAKAIGSTIRVMNLPFTVVGVAPPRFIGIDVVKLGSAAIWLPLGVRSMLESGPSADPTGRPGDRLDVVARLASEIQAEDVGPLSTVVATRLAARDPVARSGLAFQAERLTGMSQRQSSTQEFIVAVALVAALIVVITCSNVSALLLGRAVARRHEVGVRLSLGASRFRIVQQMLTESLVFALAGAMLGLGLYAVSINVAYATMPGLLAGLEPKPATFLGAAALALITTFVFGLAPALHASRAGIGEVIKNSGTQAMRRTRLQTGFVIVQLASSQPLLIVTSLVLLNLRGGPAETTVEASASVVTLRVDLFGGQRESTDVVAVAEHVIFDRIRQRLVQVPEVESAAVSSGTLGEWFESSGTAEQGGGLSAQIRQVYVTADYFALRGISVLGGQAIGQADDHPGSTAIVVNEMTARRFWPGQNPVGNRLLRRPRDSDGQPQSLEVIGVVGSAPFDVNPETPMVFVPLATAERVGEPTVIVKTAGDAGTQVPHLKRAITEIEPLAGIGAVQTLADLLAERRRESFQSNAAALAVGAAALLLASLGLYAIIALAVAQRTREIGVRLAVGASPAGVVRMFLGNGLKVSVVGLAIGLPLTVAGIRLVQASVVGFTLEKVVAVLVVIPVLTGVAVLASWLPARRAGRVDPLVALRSE